jgi:hypothetical protein
MKLGAPAYLLKTLGWIRNSWRSYARSTAGVIFRTECAGSLSYSMSRTAVIKVASSSRKWGTYSACIL